MGPRRPNSKAVAGNEKKTAHAAELSARDAVAREAETSREWQQGANTRGQSRATDAATKADEAARKRLEKADMLAAEEAELGSGGRIKAPVMKKKGGKKKDDLSLLGDALIGAAEKKNKAKKRAEMEKKERGAKEARARAEKQQEEQKIDPLMQNTNMMIEGALGREGNKLSMEGASGLDGALETLNISGGMEIKSQRALHMAFEERMLPIMKEDYPGLRLTQYKEKMFALWKKSPENPQNQPLPDS